MYNKTLTSDYELFLTKIVTKLIKTGLNESMSV